MGIFDGMGTQDNDIGHLPGCPHGVVHLGSSVLNVACNVCVGIAMQIANQEKHINNTVINMGTYVIPEKEVNGERIDNQIKLLEGKDGS